MYAHQSFIRGKPELLLNLRKSSSASRRKMSVSSSSGDSCDSSNSTSNRETTCEKEFPITSPITVCEKEFPVTSPRTVADPFLQTPNTASSNLLSYQKNTNHTWLTFPKQPLLPKSQCLPNNFLNNIQSGGAGRLDLLALAVEHASF